MKGKKPVKKDSKKEMPKEKEMKEKDMKKISPKGMKDMKRCGKTSGKM